MIEWLPTVRVQVVKLACPLEFDVPAPMIALPSLKLMVPVGVPLVDGFTVAVNVTDWPNVDRFCDDTTVVVVLALFTVCFTTVQIFGL